MGIPFLINTLERYAVHELLQNHRVVIDGPALAYHILYKIKANGIPNPSYELLGQAVILWLDGLGRHDIIIRAIYFDGFLPASKLHTRMERMNRGNTALIQCLSYHPKGLPWGDVTNAKVLHELEFFTAKKAHSSLGPDPSFLVPAIIEAIRSSTHYREVCHMVPGEADVYCAANVGYHGGTVLTSDSDLLAHELGDGNVVFFRDICKTADSNLSATLFSPRKIYKKLGLPSSLDACRLAYERKLSSSLKLPELLRLCSLDPKDQGSYAKFRQQYLTPEPCLLPKVGGDRLLSLDDTDPRLSELLLQLGTQEPVTAENERIVRIFLPILMDNPNNGTAWGPSAPVRRLAYTMAQRIFPPTQPAVIHEYRRVQNPNQKGREILLMSLSEANKLMKSVLKLRATVKQTVERSVVAPFLMVVLALNVLECDYEGKKSHVMHMLTLAESLDLTSLEKSITWDLLHFTAQIQAGYYSFRILRQVVSKLRGASLDSTFTELPALRELLCQIPPLSDFPDAQTAFNILQTAQKHDVRGMVSGLIGIESTTRRVHDSPNVSIEDCQNMLPKKYDSLRQDMRSAKVAINSNLFSLLSLEE